MPPSTPIDSDLTGATLWVLEEATIWKTDEIGGGDAVWVESYTVEAYEAANGNSNTKFLRIRANSVIVYVLAMTQTADQVEAGEDMYWLTCIHTLNGGQTWHENGIVEFAFSQPDYMFAQDPVTPTVSGATATVEMLGPYKFRVHGTTGAGNVWHIIQFTVEMEGFWEANNPASMRFKVTGTFPATAADEDEFAADWKLWWNPVTSRAAVYEGDGIYLLDNLNPGLIQIQQFRLDTGKFGTGYGGSFDFTLEITEVNGVPVASGPPTAFDVAPSNWMWLYTSVADKIYISTDFAWHWKEFFAEHGAHDIRVDPQLAGVIYYASTEGDLNLMVRQADGSGAINATLDMETPTATPLRIERDLNSGRLWWLANGSVLKMRNLGSWSTQKTGLSGARGLHAYLGGKLIFVDAAEIYVSDDYGETIAAKKGGWSGYSSGINSHRIASDE